MTVQQVDLVLTMVLVAIPLVLLITWAIPTLLTEKRLKATRTTQPNDLTAPNTSASDKPINR